VLSHWVVVCWHLVGIHSLYQQGRILSNPSSYCISAHHSTYLALPVSLAEFIVSVVSLALCTDLLVLETGSARMNAETGKMNPLVAEVATPLDVISNDIELGDAVHIVQSVQVVDSSTSVSRSGAAAEEEGDGNEPADISAEKSHSRRQLWDAAAPSRPQQGERIGVAGGAPGIVSSSALPAAADMNDKSSAQVCRSCCVKLSGFKYSLTCLVKYRCRSCGLVVCMSCSPTKEAVDGFHTHSRYQCLQPLQLPF